MNRYDYEGEVGYKVHPLANLFPDLSKDEFEKLKRDIEAHGQLQPIIVSGKDGDGIILDGRHRLRACKELGLVPKCANFALIVERSPHLTEADFIWSVNVLRRHLTADQRAAIGLKWVDTMREAAKERQKAGLKKGDELPVRADSPAREKSDRHATRNALARSAQTTTHKIRQAETVSKKSSELIPKIAAGELKLKDAVKETLIIETPPTEVERVKLKPKDVEESASIAGILKKVEDEIRNAVDKLWPKGRDFTPVIKSLRWYADSLEAVQLRRNSGEIKERGIATKGSAR
jgi:hypothetical protein